MKKTLSIILAILIVVTMIPMSVLPASAAENLDYNIKLEVVDWAVYETSGELIGEFNAVEHGDAFYDVSLTQADDGTFTCSYQIALERNGGNTAWGESSISFKIDSCEDEFLQEFEKSFYSNYNIYYTLKVTRSAGDSHTFKDATCVAPKTCAICGVTEGDIDATAHSWANLDGICANGCGLECTHENLTGSVCEICGEHICSYNNGFCTECDAYQPATLVTNENYESFYLKADYVGYYAISNAGQLFWYANYINTVDRTANAVITEDIDLENRPWTPIGSTGENSNNFRGIFDGQNYIIRGLYVEGDRAGLGFFGEVRTGTVKNFTIYGEVVVNTEVDYVGGVIGSICGVNGENDLERNGAIIQNIKSFVNLTVKAHGVGKIGGFVGYANHQSLIEKCSWYGTFDAGEYRVDNGAGGFIGRIQENSSEVTIRNCAAYGTIKTNYAGDYNDTATIYMGGFLSFSNTSAKTTLENCLFAGRFKRGENLTDEAFLGAFGTLRSVNAIKNCYYLGDDGLEAVHSDSPLKPGSDNVEITKATGEELKKGTVAKKLGEYWEQGVHYPTLKDHGSHWGSETYSYTDNGDGTHDMVCTGCGYVEVYNEAHSGGTATCTEQAKCERCGASYGELDPDNHASENYTYTDNGDGTHSAVYPCCGVAVAEVPHTLDITTGKCSACGADMTAIATVTDGTNTYYAADADTLNKAVTAILENGSRTFTVELPADTEAEMITAIRRAFCDTEGVADGSINLTISGAKTVPEFGFFDNDNYFENGEKNIAGDKLKSLTLTDVETIGDFAFSACTYLESVNLPQVVTIGECAFNEWKKGTKLTSLDLPNATTIGDWAFAYSSLLTSVNLPKVVTIGTVAFADCDLRTLDLPEATTIGGEAFMNNDNLVSCSAPKATTIDYYPWGSIGTSKLERLELTAVGDFTLGNNLFAYTPTEQIDLVLNKDKETQVTQNEDGTATWKTTNSNGGKLENTFKSITFTCTDGTTNHSYTYTDNGDGTHDKECLFCDYVEVDNESHSGGTATCTEQAKCEHCGASYGELDPDNHEYKNGFCEYGCYEPAVLNGDVYEISNAGQLYWFAQQVNSGSTAINGELTADIVVNENVLTADGSLNGDGSNFRAWTPIGTEDNAYTGEFRGGGHTVSGLYFNDRTVYHVGLFGYVGSGGTVQNVGVIDSYFYGYSYVGGVAGCNCGTLQYVYNTGNVNGSRYAGGVTGENKYIVQYAYNTGPVFAMDYAGGVTGYNKYIVQYAYNTGSAGGAAYYGGIAGDNRHTLKDCYYLADSETDSFDGTTAKTAGQFEIGEVAYLLGSPFGQNIGTHVSPVLNLGYEVYQVQNCKNEVVYSNTNENLGHQYENGVCTVCGAACPGHSYENGFCTVCGAACPGNSYENGFCPYGCYEPAVLNNDGVYEISNAGQLYWFAAQVDAGKKAISGKLMADIVVNEGTVTASSTGLRVWNPIGYYNSESDYITIKGTFDGNNKTVSGLYFNSRTAMGVGLFSCVDSGSIVKNVGVINSYIKGRLYVGGVAGYVLSNGTVENCYNAGTVNGTYSHIGGVIGSNYGTVENCYNTGTVGGREGVGGVIGKNFGTVKNCYNTGTVNGSSDYVGGVVGYNYEKSIIQNCYNTGTVSGGERVGGVIGESDGTVENSYNTGIVSGNTLVGGVLGFNYNNFVQNCYNTGNISGSGDYVGGVAGWNYGGTVQNCYNTGTVSGVSSVGGVIAGTYKGRNINCYNIGTVSGESYVGGVMGNRYTSAGTATNCYYLTGCAKDGNNTVQYGIGNETIGSTTADSEGSTIGKSTEQFASGEVAYLLNGDQSTITFKQTLGTDAYPSFTGGTVYQVENCKGELGYSNTNENIGHQWVNGTCTVCEYACPHEKYTDGVCDNCDYECPHEWGEGVLTRPTFETDGYYTYTCTLCGHSYTEPTKKADTTALNDVSMKVMEYIGNDTLTQEAANEIHNSYLDILKNNGNIFDEFGFVRGDLVEEDQPAINAITEELQKIIADADEKIASGEYVKAEYTEIDEAIDDIEEKLASENVTDEGKAELEEIKKQLEEMKADENTSAADVSELEKALEDYEEELDKGIEDGTLVEVDGDAIADDVNKKWAEKLEAEGLLDEYEDFINNQKATDEAMATVDEINDFANSLEGTVAENAENIAKLNEMLDSLLESWENCLRGTHNFKDYEITSPAKCEVNAKETSTCWFCGETDEREVEGTALEHSFTKYEETESPKCGVAGKEIASCDHGCGATDEKEIEALEHADKDGDLKCDHGCGYEFEQPVDPEQPDTPDEPEDPSENCDHLCHKSGFLGFIWKIVQFFSKLFKINPVCECGAAHY